MKEFRIVTEQDIVSLLAREDVIGMHAIGRALVCLLKRQTITERDNETTFESNGRGFAGYHAEIGTNMANFYEKNKYLSPKQLAFWRKPSRKGDRKDGTKSPSQIAMYRKQILEEARRNMAMAHFTCVSFSEVPVQNFKQMRKWFKENAGEGEYWVEILQTWRLENGDTLPTEGVYFLDPAVAVTYRLTFGS